MQRLCSAIFNLVQAAPKQFYPLLPTRTLHSVSSIYNQSSLLVVRTPLIQQSCGLKYKQVLRRRCKDCYFVRRDDRLFVMCKTYGRHKQAQLKPKPLNTYILTHASQSRLREW